MYPIIWILECCAFVFSQEISFQDVLNPQLLPGNLLLSHSPNKYQYIDNSSMTGGDIKDAFTTMQYHRSMMNEFLCHNYVADEILSEVGHRTGRHVQAKQWMLGDAGSHNYKQWLSRSTVLDDVYRHYDQAQAVEDPHQDLPEGEYEGGQVTGYAEQLASDSVLGHRHEDYYGHDPWEEHGHKKMVLKDLFDLILTALAFLSFGLFVINIALPFILPPNGTTTTTLPPIRQRRHNRTSSELNEIAIRVLLSIDKFIELHQHRSSKQRECLKFSMCQNNKYSRNLNKRHRLLIPIWSFGLSWLSGKIEDSSDMLENIRASVLGLGGADCENLYPTCI